MSSIIHSIVLEKMDSMTFFIIFVIGLVDVCICPATKNINNQASSATDEAGEPLFLTPFIDAGNLVESKNRSKVDLFEDVQSFAGFLTVDRIAKAHLYFWFVEKTSNTADDAKTPLILWLEGGPGCSALSSLFTKTGPFKVTDNVLEKRDHAWTDKYHVLYFDQPVGTGFSFTELEEGYIRTQEEVAEHLYEALQQFYKIFSHLKDNDLYLAGESYGGKFAPALAYKIHSVNFHENISKIPLKGLIIGNGVSDPENQLVWGEYLEGLGLIEENFRIEVEEMQEKMKYLIRSKNWVPAYRLRKELLKNILSEIHFDSLLNYTTEVYDGNKSFVNFVTQNWVRQRIHVGIAEYIEDSKQVEDLFEEDRMKSVRPWIEELLEYYPMLFYSGQFDLLIPYLSSKNFLSKLHWSGAKDYGAAKRQVLRVGDKIAGYYKSTGRLINVLVRNAGHLAAGDQPENVFALVDRFIQKEL